MKKYNLTFQFVETAEKAQALCDRVNAAYTCYMRKKHPAYFTPWKAADGSIKYNYVVFYRM